MYCELMGQHSQRMNTGGSTCFSAFFISWKTWCQCLGQNQTINWTIHDSESSQWNPACWFLWKNNSCYWRIYYLMFMRHSISVWQCFSHQVCDWLKSHFPNTWISCGSPIIWHPHFPSLKPPDFFIYYILYMRKYWLCKNDLRFRQI
jgi:hypothetical protein